MKKLIFTLLTCALSSFLFAQVTTEPYFITSDYAQDFKVIFDATEGTGGMVGATTCYAHTGVILDLGGGKESGWTHTSSWGDNSAKYKMNKVGTDKWELTITGGIKAYYGLSDKETAKKLCFVFRTEDTKTEGKAEGGKDIFYELFPAGTALLSIDSPADDQVYKENDSLKFSAISSIPLDKIELLIDGDLLKTELNTNTASISGKLNTVGKIKLYAKGTYTTTVQKEDGTSQATTQTLIDSVSIYVRGQVQDKKMPYYVREGINFTGDNSVTLVVRAPLNEYLYILGDFNNWEMNEDYLMYRDSVKIKSVLNPEKDSVNTVLWWREFDVKDKNIYYAYQYLVDGSLQISDPYAEVVLDPWNDKYIYLDPDLPSYPQKGDGLVSVFRIHNPNEYEWKVTDFKAPAPEDLNIYELHIRDFVPSQRLWDVAKKLDYLENLGINAIELMPIQEFDGNNSWGYNPNHYFAYDKAYATLEWYKTFIDMCHERGIAVILDMVFNHATGQFPYAKLYWNGDRTQPYNPWFNEYAKHPFNVFSDFNHEYEGTRYYFKQVLRYWLDEYKVDGYRMDLSKGFTQKQTYDPGAWSKYDASRIVILKDYYDAVVEEKPNAYFILEHLGDWKEEKELADYGMLPWRNMNNNYSQAAMGYASNSNFVDNNGKGGMFEDHWVGFAESHDEERNFYKAKAFGAEGIKEKPEVYLKRVPTVIAFSQLLPGPKMMWQFGEMGYDFSINYCSDGSISDDCRTYEKPCPFSTELKWDEDPLRMEAYQNSSKVINLRTQYPEFFKDSTVTTTNCSSSNFNEPRRIDVHYVRPEGVAEAEEDIDIIILGNFNATAPLMTNGKFTKVGIWYNYMTGEQIKVKRLNKTLTIQPGELLILTSRPLSAPTDVEDVYDENATCQVVPTITEDLISVISTETPEEIQVYQLSGNVVAKASNTETISLGNLSNGTYIVRVLVGENVSTHKIIKK